MKNQDVKLSRINWVDWLKAVAIILVVIGHFPINNVLKKYIYSFHLPLFFILSGVTFNAMKYNNIKDFIKHKAKGIILPYLFLNFSYLAFSLIISNAPVSLFKVLKGIIIGNADKVPIINGPTWFLPTLFVVEVSAYFVIRFFKDNEKEIFLFSCFSLILGYLLSIRNPVTRLIWNINGIPMCLFIFMLGYIFSKYYKNDKKVKDIVDNAKIYYGLIFIIIGAYAALKNGRVSFGGMTYHYLLYTIAAFVFSTAGYYVLLNRICKIEFIGNIMSYVGKNTLFILGFHKVLLLLLIYFKVNLVFNEWFALVFAFLSVLLTSLVSIFVNKFCPFVIGKLEKTKSNYISLSLYTLITIILIINNYLN